MKSWILAIQILAFTLQASAGPLHSKALIPASSQAPIGQLPYVGAPTGLIGPTPYGPSYRGPVMTLNAGSYAYTPTQALNPYTGNNPMMAGQIGMYGGYPGGMPGAYPGMYPGMSTGAYPGMYPQMGAYAGMAAQPSSPVLSPQLLMAALAVLPGLAYQATRSSSDSDSKSERNRRDDYRSSRSRADDSKYARRSTPARDDVTEETQPRPVPRDPVERTAPSEQERQLSRNEADALLRQTDRIQQIATQPPSSCSPVPGCPTCCAETMTAEQCTASDNYLEQAVTSADDNGLKVIQRHAPSEQTVKCVREAMRATNSDQVQFLSCPKAGRPFGSAVSRPCASDALVKTMASAYELVSECFAGYIDARAEQQNGTAIRNSLKRSMFQIWNYESGWSPNAVRTAGNAKRAGVGQIFQPMIETINRKNGDESTFDQMKAHMSSSPNRACKALAKYDFKPMRADIKNSCDRIALENGNPMLNMMYSVAFMKIARQRLYKTASGIDGINPQLRERLIDQLMVWSNGAGDETVARAFDKVMKTEGVNLTGQTNEENYRAFMASMKAAIRSAGESFTREKPNATVNPTADSEYLGKTQSSLKDLQDRVNGPCGQF